MDKNVVKKELYKQNPIANFNYIKLGVAVYQTSIKLDENDHTILFEIPVNDMGEATFQKIMSAKLLIRWII